MRQRPRLKISRSPQPGAQAWPSCCLCSGLQADGLMLPGAVVSSGAQVLSKRPVGSRIQVRAAVE